MPWSVAARSGPNMARALAGRNVWHEPQPFATQTASPSRVAALVGVGAEAARSSPPSPSPAANAATTIAAAAQASAPDATVAGLTPAPPPPGRPPGGRAPGR